VFILLATCLLMRSSFLFIVHKNSISLMNWITEHVSGSFNYNIVFLLWQLLFHVWTCWETGRRNKERGFFCGRCWSKIMAGMYLCFIIYISLLCHGMNLQIGSNISSRAKAQSSLEQINAVKINNLLHCYFHLHSMKLQMESNISSRVKAHSSGTKQLIKK